MSYNLQKGYPESSSPILQSPNVKKDIILILEI
jgi:hypothetical protein